MGGGKPGAPAGQPRWGAKPAFLTMSQCRLSRGFLFEWHSWRESTDVFGNLSGWEGGLAPADLTRSHQEIVSVTKSLIC